MDNKNNRQFYWQVKDFLTKKPDVQPKPQNTLVNTVKSVINNNMNRASANIDQARQGIANSSGATKNAVSNILNMHDANMQREKSPHKGYTNNVTSNIFNIFKK